MKTMKTMNPLLPPTFLEKANNIIQKNLDNENFSVEQLAELLHLSSSQVYRKIKYHSGLSPSVYIRNIRLEQSRQLIEHSELSLSEITCRVGFSCLSYYSRCFSAYFGFPPSFFKRKNQVVFRGRK